jgi:penicillin-binding protein 1C
VGGRGKIKRKRLSIQFKHFLTKRSCIKLSFKKQIALLLIILGIVTFWLSLLHPLFDRPFSLVLEDRNNELLGATIAKDEQWRFPSSTNLPDKYVKALICFEDKRFFNHPGVDPIAIARAVIQNIRAQRIVSGASTITMQVIRLSRQKHSRTFIEKIKEIFLSLRLELSKSKHEILILFASHAPFGGNVVGLDAASWRYFGVDAFKLSWAESAMLAVLPNSPSLIHPAKNRKKLKKKRDRLLDKMSQKNIINDLVCNLAKQEPLPLKPYPIPMLAPHLLNRIALEKRQKSRSVKAFGTSKIVTTIDKKLQDRAVKIVNQHHINLSSNGIENAAAIIIDVKTGAVLSYIGNIQDFLDTKHGNHVDLITSPRSTGSILKPILYAGMMEAGELLPSQLVSDVPLRIGGFSPKNYSKTYQGAVPAYKALARSLNVPAVKMLKSFGVDRFYTLLKKLGISTLHRSADGYGLTLILGGAEGTLWDISSVYLGMAHSLNHFFSEEKSNLNLYKKPHYLLNSPSDNNLSFPFGPGANYLTFQAMLEVVRPGAEAAWQSFSSSKKIAWKTGTSYGYRDAWAVGITPDYVVGVWAGNADGEGRAGLTGATSAAPIMFDLFGLLKDGPWFDSPESRLIEIKTCAKSGYRAGPYCRETKLENIVFTGLKSPVCPYCQVVHCDSTLSFQVNSDCERVTDIRNINWFVLPPVLEYYYKQKHSDYHVLPPFRTDCSNLIHKKRSSVMSIVYPDESGQIYIPRILGGEKGKAVFELVHRKNDLNVYWHLDEEYVGVTREIHQMEFAPGPGSHILTLIDENGEFLSRKFKVLSPE